MDMVLLSQDDKGYPIHVEYDTQFVYEPLFYQQAEQFGVVFQRTALPEAMHCSFDDTLFSDWLEDPLVIGAMEQGQLLGFIELSKETWNNRMRISNLYVEHTQRRKQIGSKLMEEAKKKAKLAHVRALILETQSCNDPAISFYFKQGFRFLGCDLNAYSNHDIDCKEIRIELVYPINE